MTKRLQHKNCYHYVGGLLSLALHGLIIISYLVYQNLSPRQFSVGDRQPASISAYLSIASSAPKPSQLIPSISPQLAVQAKANLRSIKTTPLNIKQMRTHQTAHTAVASSHPHLTQQHYNAKAQTGHLNGQQTQALLSILHAAIAQHQHYPASALALERKGRITLSFKLAVNGTVSNLQIIKSSGTTSLDAAALAAVNDAAPFKQAVAYLTTAQQFNIDVVFG